MFEAKARAIAWPSWRGARAIRLMGKLRLAEFTRAANEWRDFCSDRGV